MYFILATILMIFTISIALADMYRNKDSEELFNSHRVIKENNNENN
jgi:hypothetical protein